LAEVVSSSGNTVTVKLAGLAGGEVELRQRFGFEILGVDKLWLSIPIAAAAGDLITVGTADFPAKGIAIRYLWNMSPCTLTPYSCPVYVKVESLGTLSGEFDLLPLGPFIAELSESAVIV